MTTTQLSEAGREKYAAELAVVLKLQVEAVAGYGLESRPTKMLVALGQATHARLAMAFGLESAKAVAERAAEIAKEVLEQKGVWTTTPLWKNTEQALKRDLLVEAFRATRRVK